MISKLSNSSLLSKPYYKSMLAGNAPYELPGDFDFISTTVLGSDQSTILLSNLDSYAGTYKHLQLRMLLKGQSWSYASTRLGMRINGNATAYPRHILGGNGSVTFSSYGGAMGNATVVNDRLSRKANVYTPFVFDILDAFNTNKNTTIKVLSGNSQSDSGEDQVSLAGVLFTSTANITSLDFCCGNVSWNDEPGFSAGSSISIYGIKG